MSEQLAGPGMANVGVAVSMGARMVLCGRWSGGQPVGSEPN